MNRRKATGFEDKSTQRRKMAQQTRLTTEERVVANHDIHKIEAVHNLKNTTRRNGGVRVERHITDLNVF